MKLFSLVLIYFIQSLVTCLADEPKAVYRNLDAVKTKAIIAKFTKEKKTLLIIDVRTKEEYDREHFPKAKLINFFGPNFEKKLKELDKNKAYLLHCQSGGRSRGALKKMQELGFKEVYHLDGGILAWKKSGGELTD
jgi:phage shock protein E